MLVEDGSGGLFWWFGVVDVSERRRALLRTVYAERKPRRDILDPSCFSCVVKGCCYLNTNAYRYSEFMLNNRSSLWKDHFTQGYGTRGAYCLFNNNGEDLFLQLIEA